MATYALIDCCDATATFESLAKLSSSRNPVPDKAPFKIGAVKVLFVNVCEPVNVVTTDGSIAMSFVFAMIPVPPTTFSVASPDEASPVRPAPATIPVISPCCPDTVKVPAASS